MRKNLMLFAFGLAIIALGNRVPRGPRMGQSARF